MSYEDRNEDLRDSFENASSVLETAWDMSESTDSEQMQNFVEFLQDLSCEFYALLVSAFSFVFVAIRTGSLRQLVPRPSSRRRAAKKRD